MVMLWCSTILLFDSHLLLAPRRCSDCCRLWVTSWSSTGVCSATHLNGFVAPNRHDRGMAIDLLPVPSLRLPQIMPYFVTISLNLFATSLSLPSVPHLFPVSRIPRRLRPLTIPSTPSRQAQNPLRRPPHRDLRTHLHHPPRHRLAQHPDRLAPVLRAVPKAVGVGRRQGAGGGA